MKNNPQEASPQEASSINSIMFLKRAYAIAQKDDIRTYQQEFLTLANDVYEFVNNSDNKDEAKKYVKALEIGGIAQYDNIKDLNNNFDLDTWQNIKTQLSARGSNINRDQIEAIARYSRKSGKLPEGITTQDIIIPSYFKPREKVEADQGQEIEYDSSDEYNPSVTLNYDTVVGLAYSNAAHVFGEPIDDIMNNHNVKISYIDYKQIEYDGTKDEIFSSLAWANQYGNSYLAVNTGGHWISCNIHKDDDGKMSLYLMDTSNVIDEHDLNKITNAVTDIGKTLGMEFNKAVNVSLGNQQVSQCCGLTAANNLAGMIKFFTDLDQKGEQQRRAILEDEDNIKSALHGKDQNGKEYIRFRPERFTNEEKYVLRTGKAQLHMLETIEKAYSENKKGAFKEDAVFQFLMHEPPLSAKESKLCKLLLDDSSLIAKRFRDDLRKYINKSSNDINKSNSLSQETIRFLGTYDDDAKNKIQDVVGAGSRSELWFFQKLYMYIKEKIFTSPWKNESIVKEGVEEFTNIIHGQTYKSEIIENIIKDRNINSQSSSKDVEKLASVLNQDGNMVLR